MPDPEDWKWLAEIDKTGEFTFPDVSRLVDELRSAWEREEKLETFVRKLSDYGVGVTTGRDNSPETLLIDLRRQAAQVLAIGEKTGR